MVYFYIKFRLSKQPAVFIRMSNKYLKDYKTTLGVILPFWKRFHNTCHFYPSPCLSYSSFAYIRYLSVYFSFLQLHIFLQVLYHMLSTSQWKLLDILIYLSICKKTASYTSFKTFWTFKVKLFLKLARIIMFQKFKQTVEFTGINII